MKSYLGALALALAASTACGGAPKGVANNPAVAQTFPVLAMVPAHATYVVVASRVDRLTVLFRDGLRMFQSINKTQTPDAVDDNLRQELGASLINSGDLAEIGFAYDRSAALFSTQSLPTMLFPVADRAKVMAYLAKATKDVKFTVSDHHGVALSSWGEGAEPLVAYAFVGDWLVIHVGQDKNPDPDDHAAVWLDEIIAAQAGPSAATDPDLAWALAQAGNRKDLIGILRWPRYVDQMIRAGKANQGQCDGPAGSLRDAAGRFTLSASIASGKHEWGGFLELSPAGAHAVTAAIAALPDAHALSTRDHAVAWFSWAVSGKLIADLAPKGPRANGFSDVCSTTLELLHDLSELGSGVEKLPSIRATILGLNDGGNNVDLQAVGWLQFKDGEDPVREFPRAGQRTEAQVSGETVFGAPVNGLTEPVQWIAGPHAVRLSIGHGALETLVGGNGSQIADGLQGELVGFYLEPGKISDAKPLYQLFRLIDMRDELAKNVTLFLTQFQHLGFRMTAESGGIRVAGGYELR